MPLFGRSGDAPRVVGIDFGPPAPAGEPPAPVPVPPPHWIAPAPPAPEPPAQWGAPPPPPPPPAQWGAPPPPPPPPAQWAPPPAYPAVPPGGAEWAPPPPAPAWPAAVPEPAGAPVALAPPPAPPWSPAVPGPAFQSFDPSIRVKPAKARRDGVGREVTVIGVLLLLALVGGLVQRTRGGDDRAPAAAPAPPPAAKYTLPPSVADLNAPPSIGGEQRLSTRGTKALARDLRARYLPNDGRHAEIEFYGFDRPQYAIVAGDLSAKVGAAFEREAIGSAGWTGAPRKFGNGLVCGRMARGDALMCVWSGKRSDGIVFGFGKRDLAAMARVTAQARADLERGR